MATVQRTVSVDWTSAKPTLVAPLLGFSLESLYSALATRLWTVALRRKIGAGDKGHEVRRFYVQFGLTYYGYLMIGHLVSMEYSM